MSTSTQNVKRDPGVLERQHTRQHRWSGGKRIGAFAAAAVALVLIGALVGCASGEEATATDQTPVAAEAPENTVNARAEEVATSFVEAYGAFDVEQAITYLAADADIADLIGSVGAPGVEGTLEEFRLLIAFLEAQGYKQMFHSCEELASSAAGTALRCTFDFHAIRSDEMGRGPFSGSYLLLTVRDGEIVQASKSWAIEEFSPQMWEPFANWVSKTHPKDAAVMYADGTYSGARLSEESIRLWERHTRGYVEEVGRRA
jgi:hypothetical protein